MILAKIASSLVTDGTQCWTCPIFDELFDVISRAAGAAYYRMTSFAVIIFCVLLAFYILNVVWQNLKNQVPDPMFQKSLKPVLIRSLLALALLSSGLMFPKLISRITFEPTADITLLYAKTILPSDIKVDNSYTPITLSQDGMFNKELRDTMLELIKVSVSSFQVYINFGISIMDKGFSLSAVLHGIGGIIRHFIIFMIGLFLTYNFIKLFIKYSFCFMDIIFAMAMFAFFFPLSIIFFIFKDAENAPGWMKNLGADLGAGQIKKLINAIVSVASAILTYTIIMLVIKGFLDSNGTDAATMSSSVQSFYSFDLENSSAEEITLAGAIVLVYVIRYIADQIPQITQKILSVFGVKQEDSLSKEMGENVLTLTGVMLTNAKQGIKTIIKPEETLEKQKKETTESSEKDSSDKKDKK